nr:MAG TPA: hypothetical protein [Caudoviricetes sp.]
MSASEHEQLYVHERVRNIKRMHNRSVCERM